MLLNRLVIFDIHNKIKKTGSIVPSIFSVNL
jgi:hypothetical protein